MHFQDAFQESSEHPKLTAINAKLRERQDAQESREREVKTELVQKAANYLEDFYKVSFPAFSHSESSSCHMLVDAI